MTAEAIWNRYDDIPVGTVSNVIFFYVNNSYREIIFDTRYASFGYIVTRAAFVQLRQLRY